ncbi:MAG TPA: hypothetical protein VFW87_18460 [Pirellulales bacterium]|nr:hypothetical protein [Pirellulales bacterium]
MSNDVEKLIQDLRSLPPDDRRNVLAALKGSPALDAAALASDEAADEAYQKLLLEAGLISEVRRRCRDQRSFERFQPVPISGEPLSRTIIEERR